MSECDVIEGRIYHRNRLFIPDSPGLRLQILHRTHSSPISGHPGRVKNTGPPDPNLLVAQHITRYRSIRQRLRTLYQNQEVQTSAPRLPKTPPDPVPTMERYLDRPCCQPTHMRKAWHQVLPHPGRDLPPDQDATLPRNRLPGSHSRRRRLCQRHLSPSRCTRYRRFRPRNIVRFRVYQSPIPAHRDNSKTILSLPPSNKRTDRSRKRMDGTIPQSLHMLPPRRLGRLVTPSRVCSQQPDLGINWH